MTLMRTFTRFRPREALRLLLAVVAVAGLTAGCNVSTDAVDSSGPFYRLTPDIKDSSTYLAGTILSVPMHVIHDGGFVPGVTVHWAVLSGHGQISDTVSTTDTLGVARVVWTLGTTADQNSLVAAIGDAADTLHITGAIGSPSYLDIVGARSDTVSVGVPVSLGVIVRDRPGNGVPGATVNWTSSGGSLSPSSTVSDGTGTATASFVASAPGTYSVTADLPLLASEFFQIVVR